MLHVLVILPSSQVHITVYEGRGVYAHSERERESGREKKNQPFTFIHMHSNTHMAVNCGDIDEYRAIMRGVGTQTRSRSNRKCITKRPHTRNDRQCNKS